MRKVLARQMNIFCGDFQPRHDEEMRAEKERIFHYANAHTQENLEVGMQVRNISGHCLT